MTECVYGVNGEVYWTAGNKIRTEPDFEWRPVMVDHRGKVYYDSPMLYTNWADGYPTSTLDECMAVVADGDYKWENFECYAEQMCAICELDPATFNRLI